MTPYYSDDYVTLYHADNREVLPSLGRFDLPLTDPPYPGREDLFPTEAVLPVLRGLIPANQSLIFWPCIAEFPCGTPDAVHVWHKSVPIHPKSVTGNVSGHQYERILSYGCGARCEVVRMAAIMPGFAACCDEFTDHPTQKPLALMRWCISLADKKGRVDTILDPFAGSGTTGRAAKDMGRKCVLIEREERYCEIAAKRMRQEVLDFTQTEAAQ